MPNLGGTFQQLQTERDRAQKKRAYPAQGDYASEFTAMITAVRKWAETQVGWDHPQKAIKDALMKKTCGRVFQTDCPVDALKRAGNGPVSEWKAFLARTDGKELYFDYTVMA